MQKKSLIISNRLPRTIEKKQRLCIPNSHQFENTSLAHIYLNSSKKVELMENFRQGIKHLKCKGMPAVDNSSLY